MKLKIISDTHFGHKNILKYEPIRLKNLNIDVNKSVEEQIKEHDEKIISIWNKNVLPGETIIHLGDFALTNKENIIKIKKRLNGNIIYVRGNHDNKLKDNFLTKINITEISYYRIFMLECGDIILFTHKPFHGTLEEIEFYKSKSNELNRDFPIEEYYDKININIHGHIHSKELKENEKKSNIIYINASLENHPWFKNYEE